MDDLMNAGDIAAVQSDPLYDWNQSEGISLMSCSWSD
jgi:hypothetical protein